MLSIVRGKHELHDKTLGIVGYGRLGKMVEQLCEPLFKKIISVDKGDSLDGSIQNVLGQDVIKDVEFVK